MGEELEMMTTVNSRRRFLRNAGLGVSGLAIGPSLLAACGDDADTAVPTTTAAPATTAAPTTTAAPALDAVRQANGWINNVEFGGIWVALENGYFAENGIDPTFLAGGPNAPSPPVVVAAEDADWGQDPSMLRIFQAMAEGGADWVLFGTQFQTSPSGVMSLPDRPVRTAEDLVGIKFLGQPGAENLVAAALKIGGFDDTDFEFIPAGFTPEPLVERQGEAYSCFTTNQPLILEEQGYVNGEDFLTATWEDLGLPLYSNVLFTPRSYAESNHDILVRYMRGLIKGWEVNEDDPVFAARLSVEKYGVDLGLNLNQQTRENETQIPLHRGPLTEEKGLFWIDPDRIADEMYPAMEAIGVDPLPPLETLVDLTILEDAFDGRTTMR